MVFPFKSTVFKRLDSNKSKDWEEVSRCEDEMISPIRNVYLFTFLEGLDDNQ